MNVPEINLVMAWGWILCGFVSGLVLGTCFHREDWLGGYGSFRRRLYRLGHISFFGLGAVNFIFFVTVRLLPISGPLVNCAALAFVVGAATMPACCVAMAHWPRSRHLFAIPVLSLVTGAVLTILEIL
jgi:hypothetical protein